MSPGRGLKKKKKNDKEPRDGGYMTEFGGRNKNTVCWEPLCSPRDYDRQTGPRGTSNTGLDRTFPFTFSNGATHLLVATPTPSSDDEGMASSVRLPEGWREGPSKSPQLA